MQPRYNSTVNPVLEYLPRTLWHTADKQTKEGVCSTMEIKRAKSKCSEGWFECRKTNCREERKQFFCFFNSFVTCTCNQVESIEYPIYIQLEDIVKQNNLQKYDVALMCSVKYKVAKYNKKLKQKEWRSDVRAIRDAIAHSHYSIIKVENDSPTHTRV